ncbi:unnamed protein product [Phaeothamnion confervicola]
MRRGLFFALCRFARDKANFFRFAAFSSRTVSIPPRPASLLAAHSTWSPCAHQLGQAASGADMDYELECRTVPPGPRPLVHLRAARPSTRPRPEKDSILSRLELVRRCSAASELCRRRCLACSGGGGDCGGDCGFGGGAFDDGSSVGGGGRSDGGGGGLGCDERRGGCDSDGGDCRLDRR